MENGLNMVEVITPGLGSKIMSVGWIRPQVGNDQNNIALFFGQDPCVSGLLKRDIVYTLRGTKSQIT